VSILDRTEIYLWNTSYALSLHKQRTTHIQCNATFTKRYFKTHRRSPLCYRGKTNNSFSQLAQKLLNLFAENLARSHFEKKNITWNILTWWTRPGGGKSSPTLAKPSRRMPGEKFISHRLVYTKHDFLAGRCRTPSSDAVRIDPNLVAQCCTTSSNKKILFHVGIQAFMVCLHKRGFWQCRMRQPHPTPHKR
jgi:hypothetical protein